MLISICHGEDIKKENQVCDFKIETSNTKTFNCSKRGLNLIPEWSKELKEVEEGTNNCSMFDLQAQHWLGQSNAYP